MLTSSSRVRTRAEGLKRFLSNVTEFTFVFVNYLPVNVLITNQHQDFICVSRFLLHIKLYLNIRDYHINLL